MKILCLFFFSLLISCGYPDIDTVPDFKDLELTNEELIDLCSNESSVKNNDKICKQAQ